MQSTSSPHFTQGRGGLHLNYHCVPVFALMTLCLCLASPTLRAGTHIYYWGDYASFKTNIPPAATNIVSLAGGDEHIVALRADGTVLSWGPAFVGVTDIPPDVTNAVAIAAGSTHSVALLSDGTVRFWGFIISSQVRTLPPALGGEIIALAKGCSAQSILALRADNTLVDCGNPGYGLTNVPITASNVISMAVGSDWAGAVRADGAIVTWGQFYPVGSPAPPLNLSNIVSISGGISHIAVLQANGKPVVWPRPAPTSATNIIAISSGGNHDLALRANGQLIAWGDNSYGELNIPAGLSNIVGFSGTTWGSLALTADDGPPLLGQVLLNPAIIGFNTRLQVTAISSTPVSYQWFFNGTAVPGATNSTLSLTNVQFAQAGIYSVIVSNQFGTATNSNLNLVVAPAGIIVRPQSQTALVGANVSFNVAAIGPGPFGYQWQVNGAPIPGATNSTLTLTNVQMSDAGPYSAIVSNSFGQVVSSDALLTVVPFTITSAPPDQSSFPGATVTMSIGVQCNIPLTYQWQFQGVSLDGATASSLTLTNLQYAQAGEYSVLVSTSLTNDSRSMLLNITTIAEIGTGWNGMGSVPWALSNIVALANGNAHSLALLSDGTVQGWGYSIGQIPAGLTNVIAVSAGEDHSLVLNADGTVVGWGGLTPPPGLSNVVAVACGYSHSLALKADGTVVAWGDNGYGQTNVPAGLTNIVAIAGGQYHSLALNADGQVSAWGYDYFGQTNVPRGLNNIAAIAAGSDFSLGLRGDGTIVPWGGNYDVATNVPVTLSNVVTIATGSDNGLALRADGTVVSWGDNTYGETTIPIGLANVTAIFGSDGPYSTALVGQSPPTLNASLLQPAFNTNGFTFAFPSQNGRVYLVEYKNFLTDTNWTPLPLIPGTGRIIIGADPTATGAQRFYRVRRW